MNNELSLENFKKEFGWLGLIVGFLVSDFTFSAFVNLFEGILTGPSASLEAGITIGSVFLQTLGLSLGVLLSFLIFQRTGTNNPAPYAAVMLVAALISNALGVGSNIDVTTYGSPSYIISQFAEFYLSLYGVALAIASILIGLFFGRWADLLLKKS